MSVRNTVIVVAVTAAATWGVSELWDSFGYVTPEKHNRDIDEVHLDIAALANQNTALAQKIDRNFWVRLCDEWQEDLKDLIDLDGKTDWQLELIRQMQEAISANQCHQFAEGNLGIKDQAPP